MGSVVYCFYICKYGLANGMGRAAGARVCHVLNMYWYVLAKVSK